MFEFEIIEAAMPIAATLGAYRARDLLPTRVRETVRSLRHDRAILALPDRRYVEDILAPQLGALEARDVLFVGCRSYTRRYPDLFRRYGVTLWTTDIDAAAARFGAKGRHVTVDALELSPDTFGRRFDAVVFSGVIGFGVDSDEQIAKAAPALASLLDPGALLVLGWNSDRSSDPLTNEAWKRAFRSRIDGEAPNRVRFEGCTHVFDYLEKREIETLN